MLVDEKNLSSGVIKLALPAVMEQSLVMVVGVVSTIFVGRLGKEALSAVGIVNQTIAFILVLSVALSTGSTVLVARLIGEGKENDAREAMRQSLILGGLAFILVAAVCHFLSAFMIHLFFGSAAPEVQQIAILYFDISMAGLPFLLINAIISGNMRGAGNTKTPMLIAFIVNIVNVVLSYLLIFGLDVPMFHFPAFGVAGAAWAVSISRAVGGIVSILAIRYLRSPLKTRLLDKYKPRVDLLQRIARIGFPAMLEQVVMQGGFLMIQIVMAGIGTTAMAVMNIGNSINSMAYIPTWGFGLAATTLIGQCLGEGRPEMAAKSGWKANQISLGVSVVLSALIFIYTPQLLHLYTSDPEVLGIGVWAIRIFSFSQPFLSFVVVLSGALRGAGDIKYVMLTSFVGIWGLRLLLTVLLNAVFHLGAFSIWVAYDADFVVRAVMYIFRFRRGRWKEIKV